MLEKSQSESAYGRKGDLDGKGELFADPPMGPTSTIVDLFDEGSVDPVYQAKARILNAAIQDMGMGKYQVRPLLVENRTQIGKPGTCCASSGGCLQLRDSDGSRTCSILLSCRRRC